VDYDFSEFNNDEGVKMVDLYEFINKNTWFSTKRRMGKQKIARIELAAKDRYLEINNPIDNLILNEDDIATIENIGKNHV
jgi:hypothetical protein